jgi:hypothetical protein
VLTYSQLNIGSVFNSQVYFLDCLTTEDGTDRASQNISN